MSRFFRIAAPVLGLALLLPSAAFADRRVDVTPRVIVISPGIAHADLKRGWWIAPRPGARHGWRDHAPRYPRAGLPTDRVWRDRREALHRDFRPRRHVRHQHHGHEHARRHRHLPQAWWWGWR